MSVFESRSKSPRYPYPAERETRYSGIKRSAMTCAVLKQEVQESSVRPFETCSRTWSRMWNLKFHKAVQFSLEKLGKKKLKKSSSKGRTHAQ